MSHQRCPNCRRHFRVPKDEWGEHSCPYCGYDPVWEKKEEEHEMDEEDEKQTSHTIPQ